MTNIEARLRRLYVDTGINYVQEATDEIDRNRSAIAELVVALDSLCLRIDNEGASPMHWAEYDSACAALEKHSTTTKGSN